MKRALNILLFLGLTTGAAQEKNETVYSVYFSPEAVSVLKAVNAVSSSYFKKYQLENTDDNQLRFAAGEYLFVDASGIYFEKNKLLFITREQVREEGKYEVRDGYIFGVHETDSFPTALEGEKYYFLLPSTTYLYNMKSGPSSLFEGLNQGEYLITTPEENGYLSAIYLRFSSGKVDIRELLFGDDLCTLNLVKEQEVIAGAFNTYILTPTLDEWKKLFACFYTYDSYVTAP